MFRRQFKALIEMFQAQLSAIQEALANQERAIHDASGRQEEAWSRIEREFSEMRSGDEYKRGARTYRHKSYRQQVILNYLTGVAFLAAFAYVVITGLQLRQMRKSTKATQAAVEHADRNFQIDERAWIGFSFIPGNLTFTVGKPFFVPTMLLNSGKTPAKNVSGEIVVGIFPRGSPIDFSYAPGHAHYVINAGTVFPNGKFEESFEGIEHGQSQAQAIIIDKPLLAQLLSSSRLVIVHGRIRYCDVFGNSHWTSYCRVVSNPSLIPDDCMRYNRTDDE